MRFFRDNISAPFSFQLRCIDVKNGRTQHLTVKRVLKKMVVTLLLCGLDMTLDMTLDMLTFHREFRLNSHTSFVNKVVAPQKSAFVSVGRAIVRFSQQQQKRNDRFWMNYFSLVYTWLKVTLKLYKLFENKVA